MSRLHLLWGYLLWASHSFQAWIGQDTTCNCSLWTGLQRSCVGHAICLELTHAYLIFGMKQYHRCTRMHSCRTGTVRSRLAAGLFERIAEWNGWSRTMLPSSCGLHADEQGGMQGLSISKHVSLLTTGSSLGLWVRGLAQPVEAFDIDDLDRYDLVLCLDSGG